MAIALATVALIAPSGDAAADACSDCGPPTMTDLKAEPGFALEERWGVKDHVLTDGGECSINVIGAPKLRKVAGWLVLRGTGEVWTCPHSSSKDTMTATVTESDSRGWSLSAETSTSLKALGAGFGVKVTAAVSQQVTISTVTSISKQVTAAYCHRIPWQAFFQVATYEATVDYTMTRKFAWWTKNRNTGWHVHRMGEMNFECSSGTAVLDAKAPISGHFRLSQTPCTDPECKNLVEMKDLGYFPPFTPAEKDPEPPATEEPAEEEDEEPPFTSADLPDPPAGIPPPPEGFEDYYVEEDSEEDTREDTETPR